MSQPATSPRLRDYLGHMLEAALNARRYCEGIDQASFLADRKTQQAVIYNLIVLGEAAARVCADFPAFAGAHAHIPWVVMRGMRNRMAHGYFQTDLNIVWSTVQRELEPLAENLRQLLDAP